MDVPVSDAEAVLIDLIKRAEAGETIVLTRFGSPVARIVAVHPPPDMAARHAALLALMADDTDLATDGPDAARSQDFLYDEDGLPA